MYFSFTYTEVKSQPDSFPETSEPPSEDCLPPLSCSQITLGLIRLIRSTTSSTDFPFKGQNLHLRIVQNKNVTLNSVVCSMIAAILGTNYIIFPVVCHVHTTFFPFLPSYSEHVCFVTTLILCCRA